MTLGQGPRGYQDYQREENYDGPTLLAKEPLNPLKGGEVTKGIYNVSTYAALALFMKVSEGAFRVVIRWYADEAETVALGTRSFRFNQAVGFEGQLRISNLGPYVKIQFMGEAASNGADVSLVPTNRLPTQEGIPQTALVTAGSVKLKAGETHSIDLSQITTGTLRFVARSSAKAAYSLEVNVFEPSGSEQLLTEVESEKESFFARLEAYLPSLPVILQIVNGPTEQTIQWSAIVQPG
jgi:hypothetical protein